jgi:hypothetical protein
MTGTRETAAQLDSAIDTILRGPGGPRRAGEGELLATAHLLRDALPRLHPRFSFEELLAVRLSAARRLADGPLPEPTPMRTATQSEAHATDGALAADGVDAADRRRRGLVAGGAIASGVSLALPIAGAAIVVWRRSRSSGGIL